MFRESRCHKLSYPMRSVARSHRRRNEPTRLRGSEPVPLSGVILKAPHRGSRSPTSSFAGYLLAPAGSLRDNRSRRRRRFKRLLSKAVTREGQDVWKCFYHAGGKKRSADSAMKCSQSGMCGWPGHLLSVFPAHLFSSTFRTSSASSLKTKGFMRNARIPSCELSCRRSFH